jgi:hypothetical protein
MNWQILKQRSYLNLIGAIILVAGWGSAALLYQRASNVPYGSFGYEIVDGTVYPVMPQDSKMYVHNLELYGGKFNVIMDDFRRWFEGLWHGKSLAVMIGVIALIIAGGFFYAANYTSPSLKADWHSGIDHDEDG